MIDLYANRPKELDRRAFLKKTATVAGGFALAFHVPLRFGRMEALAAEAPAPAGAPGAFIEIAPDNSITILINHLEMGQGVNTSMSQLIAEELECDWSKIRALSAPVDAVYNSPMGTQMTGGSSSIRTTYQQYRRLGATLREMLISAAAKKWEVPASSCRAVNGFVTHASKGKLSYGELASAAAALPVPTDVKLKDRKNFKFIGKTVRRLDANEKSTGKATFGIDVRVPGMLYAMVARPPMPGAKLEGFNERAARAVAGVSEVIRFGESVAVLGSNTWVARRGRDALEPKWNFQGKNNFSNESLMEDFKKAIATPGVVVDQRGNVEAGLSSAKKKVVAEFEFPYLAHATMEPMNCTMSFDGSSAEIWSGHQMPTMDRQTAAQVLGIAPEKVKVNTVYAGGSFGRRASKYQDYVAEAAQIVKVLKKPIKVIWTREDDMRGGQYRPMNFHRAELGYDAKGKLLAWKHQIAGQSVIGGSIFEPMMVKNGIEPMVVEGVANTKYKIPAFSCDLRRPTPDVTTLWWRSVGHTHTAYVMETLIDEMAHEAKQDPLAFRRAWLKDSKRHLAVLDVLAKHSPWGKAAPKGHAYGLAIHESFETVVGHVVDVSYENEEIRVHRVWSAVDCGQVVNPDGAKAQIEGGFIYGLSAALTGEIKIKDGQVVTSNFHDYPVALMAQAPKFEVLFTASTADPTGLGEPGVPPAAPAIANALFKLTGKRIRKLPFSKGMG